MDSERAFSEGSVLVPAVDVPSTVAVVRSLGSVGVDTVVVSEADDTPARYSAYCDEFVSVPDPDEDLLAYKDALLDLASDEDVRTIVPVREEDAYVLAKYRDEFERYVTLVCPPLSSLRQVHDRIQLAEAAESAGVPIPETRLLDDVDDWSPELIVKSRYNLLTSSYVDSLAPDEVATVSRIEHTTPGEAPDGAMLIEEMGHEPIVQEYVRPEDEYMVAALYEDGEPVASFQHRQVRGTSYLGSGGVYRESVSDSELDEVARTLLEHLEWHGLACLEYIRDAETGEFKLVEINPRMWQSLASTVRMGADFPLYYWLAATGEIDSIDPGYDVGVGCHWLKGELLHALSLFRYDSPLVERPGVPGRLWEIVTSCYRQPRFDYLSLDDPGPFVQDCWSLLEELPGLSRLQLPGGRRVELDRHGRLDRRHDERTSVDPVDASEVDTPSP